MQTDDADAFSTLASWQVATARHSFNDPSY
jgi:hypothetical protein